MVCSTKENSKHITSIFSNLFKIIKSVVCFQVHEDYITPENRKFVSEVLGDRFGVPSLIKGVQTFPNSVNEKQLVEIKESIVQSQYDPRERRCGLIARKIGVVPLWKKNGKQITSTMLQIEDNHVIKYIPPEEYQPSQTPRVKDISKFGCLLVGAGSADPSLFTKEYCGLFKESGVMPKRKLGRFLVSPNAKLLPGEHLYFFLFVHSFLLYTKCELNFTGTPLNVTHFRLGDFVDIKGKT